MICTGRETGHPKFYFYNKKNGILLRNMSNDGIKLEGELEEKPLGVEKMFGIVEKLSKGIKFVRMDLYNVNEKIYFKNLHSFHKLVLMLTEEKKQMRYLRISCKLKEENYANNRILDKS